MISFQKCDFHRHQKCDKCLSLVVFCSTDALVFDFAERCGAERSRYVDRLLALFAALCFVSRQAVCPAPANCPQQFFPTVLANITNGHASVGKLFRPDIMEG